MRISGRATACLRVNLGYAGSTNPRVKHRRGRTKFPDVPISAGLGRSVHFQGQNFNIAFKHRNFDIEMHFSCTGTYIVSSNDSQGPILDNLQTLILRFGDESPRRGGVGHLRPNIGFIK